MRSILAAVALALPIGLFGASSASAAPVSGAAIVDAAQMNTMVEEVQWRRSRVRCRLVTRGVHRWRSRVFYRTVRVCRHR